MPIHCSDLTDIIYHIISKGSDAQIIECVGPETLTFKEILEIFKFDKQKKITGAFSIIYGKIICKAF